MTRPQKNGRFDDPLVRVVAFESNASTLACRLQISLDDLIARLNRRARRGRDGAYSLDIPSDQIMARVKCSLMRGPGDE